MSLMRPWRLLALAAVMALSLSGSAFANVEVQMPAPTSGTEGDVQTQSHGSPCAGSMQVYWSRDTDPLRPYNWYGHHRITIGCYLVPGVAAYLIDCESRLFFLGRLTGAPARGFDADYCAAEGRSFYSYLVGSPMQHIVDVKIELVPTDPTKPAVWANNTSFCTGAGTPIATCRRDRPVFAGFGSTENIH